MKYGEVKTLLQETAATMKKQGIDMVSEYPQILSDDHLFEWYTTALSEGLEGPIRDEFTEMAQLVREGMLMETVYGFKPQAQLVMPVFRKMWPQLVAREALTVMPMDRPEIVHAFMVAYAQVTKADGSITEVALPALSNSFSSGIYEWVISSPLSLTVGGATSIFTAVHSADATIPTPTNLTAHLQRDWYVVGYTWITAAEGTVTTVSDFQVDVDDEGNFSFAAPTSAGVEDFVHGYVDFYNGIVTINATRNGTTNFVNTVKMVGSVSGAEEMNTNKIIFKHSKVRLNAIDHEIQAEWSIQYEQDVKAYFDLAVQAQLVDTFGNVVAMDIDRKILRRLDSEAARNTTALSTFYMQPPDTYAFGRKEWYNQIILPLNEISNQVYLNTNIATANVIIGNPMDIAILKSTSDYGFKGNTRGGELGDSPVAGTFNESWKVLSTPLQEQGKMLVLLKPENPDLAVFVFAPYRPLTITPWPLGKKPAMSFISRYATQCIRREAIGRLTITNSQPS